MGTEVYPSLKLFVDAAVVHTFELLPGQHVLGRRDGNEVQLLDNAVSSRHALITVLESPDFPGYFDVMLEDQGSRNGTRVNGEPVQSHQLEHGDIITVGRTQLRYSEPGGDETGDTGI
ncbi:MAG: FHA domain-containing protein, partial [Pseudomonadota bacterium]